MDFLVDNFNLLARCQRRKKIINTAFSHSLAICSKFAYRYRKSSKVTLMSYSRSNGKREDYISGKNKSENFAWLLRA